MMPRLSDWNPSQDKLRVLLRFQSNHIPGEARRRHTSSGSFRVVEIVEGLSGEDSGWVNEANMHEDLIKAYMAGKSLD
jgi:hypothetical protein